MCDLEEQELDGEARGQELQDQHRARNKNKNYTASNLYTATKKRTLTLSFRMRLSNDTEAFGFQGLNQDGQWSWEGVAPVHSGLL